jgi:TolB-like protein
MKNPSFLRILGIFGLALLLPAPFQPSWVLAANEMPDQKATVLFIPFQQVGPASAHSWVSQALQEALLGEVAQQAGSPAKTLDHTLANSDAASAISAGQDANVQIVIYGSYQVVDDQIRVNGQAVQVADKKVVATLKATGDLRDLFKIEDLLTYQIKAAFPQPSGIDPSEYYNEDQHARYLNSVAAGLNAPDLSTTRPTMNDDVQISDSGAVADQTDSDTVANVEPSGELSFEMVGPSLYSTQIFAQSNLADETLPYLPSMYSYAGAYDLGYPSTVYPFAYGFTPDYFFGGIEYTSFRSGRFGGERFGFGRGRGPLTSVPRWPSIGNFGRPFANPYFAYVPGPLYLNSYPFGISYFNQPFAFGGINPPLGAIPHFSFTTPNGQNNFPQYLGSNAAVYGYAPAYGYVPAYGFAPAFGFRSFARPGFGRSFGFRGPVGAPRGFSVFGSVPLNATGNFVGSRASGR